MSDFVHVKYSIGGWIVVVDNEVVEGPFSYKSEAVDSAKKIALNVGVSLYIHNKEGEGGRIIDHDKIIFNLSISDSLSYTGALKDIELPKSYNVNGEYLTDNVRLRNDLRHIEAELDGLKNDLHKSINGNIKLRGEIHEIVYYLQQGISRDSLEEVQFMPVYVYLSDEKSDGYITSIITDFMSSLGFVLSDEYETVYGSIHKKWWAASKKLLKRVEVSRELSKARRSIDNIMHKKIQSEINKNNADALSKLIAAVDKQHEAVVRVGTLVVAKETNSSGECRVIAKELTDDELTFIEEQKHLHSSPSLLIEKLYDEE